MPGHGENPGSERLSKGEGSELEHLPLTDKAEPFPVPPVNENMEVEVAKSPRWIKSLMEETVPILKRMHWRYLFKWDRSRTGLYPLLD